MSECIASRPRVAEALAEAQALAKLEVNECSECMAAEVFCERQALKFHQGVALKTSSGGHPETSSGQALKFVQDRHTFGSQAD